jgi:HEAT repeat protein
MGAVTDSLLGDLAAAGFPVDSVWGLSQSGSRYRAAVPVLVTWLPRVTSPSEKEGIIRALSVPWARPEALGSIIDEFSALPVPGDPRQELVRWAAGNAIEVLWDDARFDDLVELAVDRRYGKAREMVVLGLGRSERPEAGRVLVELLEDPVVSGHAVEALARLKVPEARPGLERMTADNRAWVRRAARRALAKLA